MASSRIWGRCEKRGSAVSSAPGESRLGPSWLLLGLAASPTGGARFGSRALERPSEAQLMAVGIGNMEEALAPFCVARRRLDPVPGGGQPGIEPVHIRVVEDHAAPPRPLPPSRLRDQVHKIAARFEAREVLVFTAIQHGEPEHPVKSDRPPHVVRREGDRADAPDHGRASPTWYP